MLRNKISFVRNILLIITVGIGTYYMFLNLWSGGRTDQAIALQAAIAIANIKYADQITQLLDGKLLEEFKRSQAWLNRMNV